MLAHRDGLGGVDIDCRAKRKVVLERRLVGDAVLLGDPGSGHSS